MQDINEVELLSPEDGSTLSFRVLTRRETEVDFETSVSKPWCEGHAPSSTYVVGSPSSLFREMAEEWRGWNGTKSWRDVEGRVAITAEADSTGHIRLFVDLVAQDNESRLHVVFSYEAGHLPAMAEAVRGVLG